MQELKELYISTFNKQPKTIEQLKGAGSNRQYYRFCDADGNSVIGVVGTSVEENEAFIYLSRHFTEKKLPVPEVYAVSNDKLRYLQQDLGSRSLFDAIADGREKGGNYSEEEIALLENTIRQLPRIQVLGAEGLDWNICYPQPSFDKQYVRDWLKANPDSDYLLPEEVVTKTVDKYKEAFALLTGKEFA